MKNFAPFVQPLHSKKSMLVNSKRQLSMVNDWGSFGPPGTAESGCHKPVFIVLRSRPTASPDNGCSPF